MSNTKTKGRCEICRRVLAKKNLTIVHDDLGDHELCAPCEEVYSANTMRYFAKELNDYALSAAYLQESRCQS